MAYGEPYTVFENESILENDSYLSLYKLELSIEWKAYLKDYPTMKNSLANQDLMDGMSLILVISVLSETWLRHL